MIQKKLKSVFWAVLIMMVAVNLQAYERNTHQYIIRQAYELLKADKNIRIPEIESHLGNTQIGTMAFVPGDMLVIGAAREDIEDVVYGYYGLFGTVITATHFWNPDNGDGSHFCISPTNECFPNAYEKAMKYIHTGPINYNYQSVTNNPYFGYCSGNMLLVGLFFEYDSLVDFYLTGRARVVGIRNIAGYVDQCIYPVNVIWPQAFRNKIVWEVLGRVAHLLSDMSVPAHALLDQHDPYLGGLDSYEQTMEAGNFYLWDYQTALCQGGLIDVTNDFNPIKSLFYTTAQIAGHFNTNDTLGNNAYGLNDPFYMYTGLAEMMGALGPVPYQFNLTEIGNVSFNYAIRSVAGLFYWFATETGLQMQPLNPPLTSAYVYGSGYVSPSMSWQVSPSGGTSPLHYQWYIKYLSIGDAIASVQSLFGAKAAPSEYWYTIGTDNPLLSINNYSDNRNFQVKCVVSDSTGTTVTSNIITIYWP